MNNFTSVKVKPNDFINGFSLRLHECPSTMDLMTSESVRIFNKSPYGFKVPKNSLKKKIIIK